MLVQLKSPVNAHNIPCSFVVINQQGYYYWFYTIGYHTSIGPKNIIMGLWKISMLFDQISHVSSSFSWFFFYGGDFMGYWSSLSVWCCASLWSLCNGVSHVFTEFTKTTRVIEQCDIHRFCCRWFVPFCAHHLSSWCWSVPAR